MMKHHQPHGIDWFIVVLAAALMLFVYNCEKNCKETGGQLERGLNCVPPATPADVEKEVVTDEP